MEPKRAKTVSEQILWLRRDIETTPMHAIKLVYLCHGWMLGIHDRSLISESVEAWRYGPVVPSIYHRYKSFRGDAIITDPADQEGEFDGEQNELIEAVTEAYRSYSAWDLSAITHEPGTPWHKVYQNGRGEGSIIPNALIRDHYRRRAS